MLNAILHISAYDPGELMITTTLIYFGVFFLVMLIVGVIVYVITHTVKSLNTKFVEMGTLSGRTRDEIISVVGPAQSASTTDNGGLLLQWIQDGYHIALLFDCNDICQGIVHESKSSF
jgi:hypothetical protein